MISLVFLLIISLAGCGNNGGTGGRNTTDAKYFNFESPTGAITDFTAASISDVVIPSQIDGVDVQEIYNRAFSGEFGSFNLTSVDIPSSVKVIGDKAFSHNDLTSVEIPDSVEKIGDGAFMVNELTSVEIPGNVEKIGEDAFASNKLTSVEILDGVKVIGVEAFDHNSLTSVRIPNSVKKIKMQAFRSNNITSVEMPADVELPSGTYKYPALGRKFKKIYEKNDKAAGVYVWDDETGDWHKKE